MKGKGLKQFLGGLFLILCTLVAEAMPNFSAKEAAWLAKHPVVKVGSGDDWAPFNYVDQYGQFKGITKDYLDLVAKKSGLRFDLKVDKWAVIFNDFREGRVDLLPAALYSKEREAYGDYLPAHIKLRDFIYARADNDAIRSFEDLNGKRLARIRGYAVLDPYLPHLKNVTIVEVNSTLGLINAVYNRQADAFLEGQATINHLLRENMIGGIKSIAQTVSAPTTAHFLVRKNDPILYAVLQKSMADITPEEHRKIFDRWIAIGSKLQARSDFTAEEQAWIDAHPVVTVGGEMDWKPFDFVDDYGIYSGVADDYLKRLAQISGLRFDVRTDMSWNELLNAFKEGKLDLLPALYRSKEREKYTLFTRSYLKLPEYIYVADGNEKIHALDDLRGKRVALVEGYEVVSWVKKHYPDIKIVLQPDIVRALQSVVAGKADAFIGDSPSTGYAVANSFIDGIVAVSPVAQRDPVSVHMGIRKELPLLHSIIEKSLARISPEEHRKIREHWFTELRVNVSKGHGERELSFVGIISAKEVPLYILAFAILLYLVLSRYTSLSILNVRLTTFNIIVMTFELLLLCSLLYELVILDRTENALAKAQSEKLAMRQALQQLQQSSDDLTRFARSYVVTGNPVYKQRYFDVLAIRDGELPRPKEYGRLYWELSDDARKEMQFSGEKLALMSIMEQLPFSTEELATIKSAHSSSDELAELEKKAFKAVEKNKRALAITMLYSQVYFDSKKRIMEPIGKTFASLEARNESQIELLEARVRAEFRYLIIAVFMFIMGNLLIFLLMREKVNKPVAYLTGVIEAFKEQRGNIEQKSFYHDEVGMMIEGFFSMQHTIAQKTSDLEATKAQIEKLLKSVQDSIDYASLIQHAMLPDNNLLRNHFSDYFVIWHPRNVVGGDIYFFDELRDKDESLLMVIDCTGHGVAGAFVTLLVKAIQRNMISRILYSDEIVDPANLLGVFNRSVKHLLKQEGEDTVGNAGFDGAILYYNKKRSKVVYAGAEIPLFYIHEGELKMIKGDRQSIGYRTSQSDYVFTNHEIGVEPDDTFYLTTDGYIDQNGGEKGFPFGKKRLKALLEQCHSESMADQQELFLMELMQYQGGLETNDDITVVGLRI
jgi:ABC-type amino acid transport substrate-binding protein/serine phosphatase RsbU (regulator of sigma subunit)